MASIRSIRKRGLALTKKRNALKWKAAYHSAWGKSMAAANAALFEALERLRLLLVTTA